MDEVIQKAWDKFFGNGWLFGKEPTRRECFEAGYKQAIVDSDGPHVFKLGKVKYIMDASMPPSSLPILLNEEFVKPGKRNE